MSALLRDHPMPGTFKLRVLAAALLLGVVGATPSVAATGRSAGWSAYRPSGPQVHTGRLLLPARYRANAATHAPRRESHDVPFPVASRTDHATHAVGAGQREFRSWSSARTTLRSALRDAPEQGAIVREVSVPFILALVRAFHDAHAPPFTPPVATALA